MKKSKLKVINNPMESDKFSLSATYACAIIWFLLSGISLCVFMFDISDTISLILGVIFFFSFVIPGFFCMKRGNQIRKIIKHGEKIKGEVVSYYRFHRQIAIGSACNKPNWTCLIVRFVYRDIFYCKVDIGHVVPNKKFGSTECNVYIYNDELFVTDFIRSKKGEPIVAIPELDNEQFKKF